MEKNTKRLQLLSDKFTCSIAPEVHQAKPFDWLLCFFTCRSVARFSGWVLGFLLTSSLTLQAQTASSPAASGQGKVFMAGAATSNITPKVGTSINGNMQDALVQNVHDETHARGIVLDDGQTRLAIVVSDLCMVSREVLD